MGSGNKNNVRNEIDAEQKRTQTQFNTLYDDMEKKRLETEQRSNNERTFLTDTLTPLAGTTGGLDTTVINNIRNLYGGKNVGLDGSGTSSGSGDSGGSSSGGSSGSTPPVNPYQTPEDIYKNFASTGGVEMERMRSQIAELEKMASTGGFDPASTASINDTIQKLKNFQYDPNAKAQIQATINGLSEIARTGGYNPDALARIQGDLNSLRTTANTGGIDPDRLAKARGTIDFMQGGGMTAEDIARYRGTGFQEFADTGGWSPEQAAEFRNRSTAAIPAMYQASRDEAERLRNIQGGSGGAGFLAGVGKLNRQTAQGLTDASRNAEIDLGNNIREGRRWGIEGLRDTEAQLQSTLGTNRTAGMSAGNQLELGVGANRISALDAAMKGETTLEQNQAANRIGAGDAAGKLQVDFQNSINDAFIKAQSGAGTLESNLASAVAQNRVKAQEVATQAEAKAQQLRAEGQLAGAQGLMAVAAQKEAAARAASAQASAARANDQANERWWATFISGNERWIGESQQSGQQNALRNLTQIYGMDPTLPRDSFQLDIASQGAAAQRGLLGIDAQMASGGKDWTDWARLGLGSAQGLKDLFGGGNNPKTPTSSTDVNSRTGGGDNPYDPNADMINYYGPGDTNPYYDPVTNEPTPTPVTGGHIVEPPNGNYDDYVPDGNGGWIYRPGGKSG